MAENNLRAHHPYIGTVLTDRHRRDRLLWADRHINGQGKTAGWFVFQMNPGLHCPIVMVGSGSTDVGVNITLTVVFSSGTVMAVGVWAGIGYGYRTQLVVIDGNLNAQKYRDHVLAPHIVPILQNYNVISVFQQDSARPHIARDNIQFLGNNNIYFIDDWPSKSPDLNPIEHLWDNLDTRVQQCQNPPGNVNELKEALLEEWNNIPQAQINNLIYSVRRRCQDIRWAYSLLKKEKINQHLPQMNLKNPMKFMIFRLYMNFDKLIFSHCAIANTNKNLMNTNVEIVPFKSRESFFFCSVYLSAIKTLTCQRETSLTGSTSFGFVQNMIHDFQNTVLNS